MKIKNNWKIVILLASAIFLSGCQSRQSTNPDMIKKIALNQEKRLGVIQSLGGALATSQATHLLRMENGKSIYLKSSQIDLGADRYAKHDVEVSGNLVRLTDGEEIMSVLSIDLIEKESKPDEVAPQWKDYKSDTLNLSLKYRDDFKLVENGQELIISGQTQQNDPISTITTKAVPAPDKSNQYVMQISIKSLSADKNFDLLKTLGLSSDSSTELLGKGFSKSKITMRALDAIKKATSDGHSFDYYLKTNDKSYQISLNIQQTDGLIQDQNFFYDVLASIDFASVAATNTPTATAPIVAPVAKTSK